MIGQVIDTNFLSFECVLGSKSKKNPQRCVLFQCNAVSRDGTFIPKLENISSVTKYVTKFGSLSKTPNCDSVKNFVTHFVTPEIQILILGQNYLHFSQKEMLVKTFSRVGNLDPKYLSTAAPDFICKPIWPSLHFSVATQHYCWYSKNEVVSRQRSLPLSGNSYFIQFDKCV